MADAVCLVDRDEAQVDAGHRGPDRCLQTFRGGVDEFVLAALHSFDPVLPFAGLEARVEVRSPHSDLVEPIHLVLHEGDERRDHESRSSQHPGGELVGQRLAGARRHDPDAVTSVRDRLDDLPLAGAKRWIPEDFVEPRLEGCVACGPQRGGESPERRHGIVGEVVGL